MMQCSLSILENLSMVDVGRVLGSAAAGHAPSTDGACRGSEEALYEQWDH